MSHPGKIGKIYYQVALGSPNLLADERDKKQLIDILLSEKKEQGYPVYAFCITDESAYLVAEAPNAVEMKRQTARAVCQFLGQYTRMEKPELSVAQTSQIRSIPELLECCRDVHCIPLRRGYVQHLGDYWWSSYKMYIGSYEWAAVDCGVLYQQFSSDVATARRRLKRFHIQ